MTTLKYEGFALKGRALTQSLDPRRRLPSGPTRSFADVHRDHGVFTAGIEARTKVILTWFSQEDEATLTRTCAPMDYGPSRRNLSPNPNRYHFWDYESDEGPHTLSLTAEQVGSITETSERFDPAGFVTWETDWFYPRDWGLYS